MPFPQKRAFELLKKQKNYLGSYVNSFTYLLYKGDFPDMSDRNNRTLPKQRKK